MDVIEYGYTIAHECVPRNKWIDEVVLLSWHLGETIFSLFVICQLYRIIGTVFPNYCSPYCHCRNNEFGIRRV